MGYMNFVDQAIESRMMDLHCGYIGRVVWTDGVTATVQPLGLSKQYDKGAVNQAVVKNVPVACKWKIEAREITHLISLSGATETMTVAVPTMIAAGDLVACLCSDRNIDGARRGRNELPTAGCHSISDSVIVGILER